MNLDRLANNIIFFHLFMEQIRCKKLHLFHYRCLHKLVICHYMYSKYMNFCITNLYLHTNRFIPNRYITLHIIDHHIYLYLKNNYYNHLWKFIYYNCFYQFRYQLVGKYCLHNLKRKRYLQFYNLINNLFNKYYLIIYISPYNW